MFSGAYIFLQVLLYNTVFNLDGGLLSMYLLFSQNVFMPFTKFFMWEIIQTI